MNTQVALEADRRITTAEEAVQTLLKDIAARTLLAQKMQEFGLLEKLT